MRIVEETRRRDEDGARRAMENVIRAGRRRVMDALGPAKTFDRQPGRRDGYATRQPLSSLPLTPAARLYSKPRCSDKQKRTVQAAPAKKQVLRKRDMMNRERPRVLRRVIFAGLLLCGCARRATGRCVAATWRAAGGRFDCRSAGRKRHAHPRFSRCFPANVVPNSVMREIAISTRRTTSARSARYVLPEKLAGRSAEGFYHRQRDPC